MSYGTFENSSLYAVAAHKTYKTSLTKMVLALPDWRGLLPLHLLAVVFLL
jgi:hypothetical protein